MLLSLLELYFKIAACREYYCNWRKIISTLKFDRDYSKEVVGAKCVREAREDKRRESQESSPWERRARSWERSSKIRRGFSRGE